MTETEIIYEMGGIFQRHCMQAITVLALSDQ